jgi:hypothetical protein
MGGVVVVVGWRGKGQIRGEEEPRCKVFAMLTESRGMLLRLRFSDCESGPPAVFLASNFPSLSLTLILNSSPRMLRCKRMQPEESGKSCRRQALHEEGCVGEAALHLRRRFGCVGHGCAYTEVVPPRPMFKKFKKDRKFREQFPKSYMRFWKNRGKGNSKRIWVWVWTRRERGWAADRAPLWREVRGERRIGHPPCGACCTRCPRSGRTSTWC